MQHEHLMRARALRGRNDEHLLPRPLPVLRTGAKHVSIAYSQGTSGWNLAIWGWGDWAEAPPRDITVSWTLSAYPMNANGVSIGGADAIGSSSK